MEKGSVCKVCDRKFFINDLISQKQNMINVLRKQFEGNNGLKA